MLLEIFLCDVIEDEAAQRGKTRWVVFFGGIGVYNCDRNPNRTINVVDIKRAFGIIGDLVKAGKEITALNIREARPELTNRQVAQVLSINKNGRPLQFRDNVE